MGSFPKIDSDMEPFSAHIYELFGSMPYWPVLFMKLVGPDEMGSYVVQTHFTTYTWTVWESDPFTDIVF